MRDPLWRLKTLPWFNILQVAGLTVVVATLIDLALLAILIGAFQLLPLGSGRLLGGGVGQSLLQFMAAGGVGALAVRLMERWFRSILPDTAVLWALVICLALLLYGKTLLPIPTVLVGMSYLQFVGLMLGLFSQGRAYWR